MAPLLQIKDLHTEFRTGAGVVRAVDGISYTVEQGETVAIVGESGSGKSVGALSILRLIPDPPGRITRGEILFAGRDLMQLSDAQMREVRGADIGMIFQEPMTSLNPVLTIGRQITETLEQHRRADPASAHKRAIELLGLVGIADPARRLKQYPHQLSGGMRQRVMIAIAIACDPKLIIADEPTTALDVTIQAQILELMNGLTRRLNVALIIITHCSGDLPRPAPSLHDGIAAVGASARSPAPGAPRPGERPAPRPHSARPRLRVPPALPLRGGRLRSGAAAARAGRAGRPPRGLPARRGDRRRGGSGGMTAPATHAPTLLEVKGLQKLFPVTEGILARRVVGEVRAVDCVDLTLRRGETLGLVGESGCGKTTTGRCILLLDRPTAGEILYDGVDLTKLKHKQLRALRRRIQVIFQDPYSSLNPRMKVGDIIAEPMKVHAIEPDAASGSESRARSRSIPNSSSATRPYPPSTSRSRRRSSICLRICASASASPTYSSLTISRWCGTSANASP